MQVKRNYIVNKKTYDIVTICTEAKFQMNIFLGIEMSSCYLKINENILLKAQVNLLTAFIFCI